MSDYWKKTLEAAAWTFVQAFIASLAATAAVLPESDWGALGKGALSAMLAAAAAALSLIKSVVVRDIGSEDSPFLSA